MDVVIENSESNLIGEDAAKLYKVRKNALKMLNDRGYFVNDDQIENLEDFIAKYKFRHELALSGIKINTEPEQSIVVDFIQKKENDKISVQNLMGFASKIYDMNITHGIYVSQGTLTNTAKEKINEMAEKQFYIEFFDENDLIVNITEHELVPKHVILNKTEEGELLQKYRLHRNQLPKILLNDPISKYLGLRRNDIVKIIRPSETAGKYVTYRIAI